MNQPLRFAAARADATTLAPDYSPYVDSSVDAKADDRARPITIRNLSKSFGENEVLPGINLHIPAGQFVAIVGRSGCGKSTLLRLIAGLVSPSTGTIFFGENGQDSRGQLRFMFQEPRLLPWARVRANVEIGLSRADRAREASGLAERALAEVGLTEKSGQWPSVLSGGQRQRVALARPGQPTEGAVVRRAAGRP